MLKSLGLSGFKSFGAEARIELAPLTLICGANSSGKSSLLQALMLLGQSVGSRFASELLPWDGPLVKLGSFKDVVHRGEGSMSFKLDVEGSPPPARARFQSQSIWGPTGGAPLTGAIELSLADPQARGLELAVRKYELVATTSEGTEARLIAERRGGRPPAVHLTSAAGPVLLGNHDFVIRLSSTDPLEDFSASIFGGDSNDVAGVDLNGLLPSSLRRAVDPVQEQFEELIRVLLLRPTTRSAVERIRRSDEYAYVALFMRQPAVLKSIGHSKDDLVDALELITSISPAQRRELLAFVPGFINKHIATRPNRNFQFVRRPLPPTLSDLVQIVALDLARLRHLGPLRQPPQALHPDNATETDDVGPQGEFTAAVLSRAGSRPVEFRIDGRHHQMTLAEAVDWWLSDLGVHSGANVRELSRYGHVLGIRDEALGTDLDLTQVGVGVSQILPVVVQSLLIPAGGILLLEQPELHLHPAVQARLLRLLLGVASTGRQVVVETHSEYLVNGVRIALGDQQFEERDAKIYFVSRVGANSSIETIRMDSRGRVKNWPVGFFDQSALDSARLLEQDLGA